MSKDMRKAVVIVLACGILWLMVGAVLAVVPQSVREWGGFLFLSLGWFAVGYGLGGDAGYHAARKEDREIACQGEAQKRR